MNLDNICLEIFFYFPNVTFYSNLKAKRQEDSKEKVGEFVKIKIIDGCYTIHIYTMYTMYPIYMCYICYLCCVFVNKKHQASKA